MPISGDSTSETRIPKLVGEAALARGDFGRLDAGNRLRREIVLCT